MDKQYFDICRNEKVYIYGAGELGNLFYQRMKSFFNVIGFIDKNNNIKREIDVLQLSDERINVKCPVFVCVHNAMWHNDIAETLFKRGFDKIVFLPIAARYISETAKTMINCYHLFQEYAFDCMYNIPVYSLLYDSVSSCVLLKRNDWIYARCPLKILFTIKEPSTADLNLAKKKEELFGQLIDTNDVPISANYVYNSIYRYFMTGEKNQYFDKSLQIMMNFNNSTVVGIDDFLSTQWDIFLQNEQELLNGGAASSISSAIDVEWNDNGYFNVIDGHHRAAYYYNKQIPTAVVRMREIDYSKWLNKSNIEDTWEIVSTYVPKILPPNPQLLCLPSCFNEAGRSMCESFYEYIFMKQISYDLFIEITDFEGYFSQAIRRIRKANKIYYFSDNTQQNDYVRAISQIIWNDKNAIIVDTLNSEWPDKNIENKTGILIDEKYIDFVTERLANEKKQVDVFVLITNYESGKLTDYIGDCIFCKCINGKNIALYKVAVNDSF